MNANQPIGIFDSGIGGLTVAKAVKEYLPDEQLIYFGDIAHLPYGDKSTAAIQAYSVKITEMLLNKRCKVILIACNSASSAAYELVTAYVGKKAKVFDVINPTVDLIRENHLSDTIGLIGTKQTVTADVYGQKIRALNGDVAFHSLPTPLLVPLIEEGITDNQISHAIVSNYLSDETLSKINALILGCTHYPAIKKEIEAYYTALRKEVAVIDSAEQVAQSLRAFLDYNLLAAKNKIGEDEFLVSDYTSAFEKTTKLFFGEEVHLEQIAIWDEYS